MNTLAKLLFLIPALAVSLSLISATAAAKDNDSNDIFDPELQLDTKLFTALPNPRTAPKPQEASEGPCLPLHSIEGSGGVFSTMTAYLTNPAPAGQVWGKPSVGFTYVDLNHGKHLTAFTITETIGDRIELGYAYNTLDVGDFYQEALNLTGINIPNHSVRLQHFNTRILLIKEGGHGLSWLPAVTFGAHFKKNEEYDGINTALFDMPKRVGVRNDMGWDFTLVGSKMITAFPRPVIISAGLRSTEASHIGLLGFTNERKIVAEGSVCALLTDQIVFAAEYRQKPDELDVEPIFGPLSHLLEDEDDWWVLALGYLVNSDMSIAAGYGHFGHVLNHTSNRGFGVSMKYEF